MGKCLPEAVILIFHDETEYISSRSAAKAVIHLLGWGYRERRGLFVMERAKAKIGAALPCQFYILGYYVYNIIFHSYFFNDIV
jgi:hypothetical protein